MTSLAVKAPCWKRVEISGNAGYTFSDGIEFANSVGTDGQTYNGLEPKDAFSWGFTIGGLRTSLDGEVLDFDGRAIPRLFAAGRTAAIFSGHGYAGSGASLGDASFFGRRAGRAVARLS